MGWVTIRVQPPDSNRFSGGAVCNFVTDEGGVVRYIWEFGNGTTVEMATATVSYTFELVGSHVVRVTASDAAGNADSATLDVSTTEAPQFGQRATAGS